MNTPKTYHTIVIGAGSAGLTAAVGLAAVGKKVLLIEKEHMGGECTNSGCIPSKALISLAKKAHASAQTSDQSLFSKFTTSVPGLVRERIQEILDEETPEAFEKLGITVLFGEAVFDGAQTLSVGEQKFTFEKCIIATGSSPRMVEIPGLSAEKILTNQNVFQQNDIPQKLLVVGAGPIGLELGQAYARLGSQVTITTVDPIIARYEEPEVQPLVRRALEADGVTFLPNTEVISVKGSVASIKEKEAEKISLVDFDKVLIAIGRVPNIPQGLEYAGIASTNFGVTINSNYQTTNKSVFAVGDVSLRDKFTHTASDAARFVVKKILLPFLSAPKQLVPKVTYLDPEFASVGMNYETAKKEFGEDAIVKLVVPFTKNDRSKTEGRADSEVIVVTAKRLTGKILGASIASVSAGELVPFFALCIKKNISLWSVQSMIFPYPTRSLAIQKIGDEFLRYQVAHIKSDILGLLKRNLTKIVAVAFWTLLVILFFSFKASSGLGYIQMTQQLFTLLTGTIWGPLVYILLYAVRPLILFPATILTALSGVLFGLWWGVVYTVVGANLSASVAYWVGRFFTKGISFGDGFLSDLKNRLGENSFISVFLTRLLFFPFDLTNYALGALRVKWAPYALATLIGTLPGSITFVAFGASIKNIESFDLSTVSLDPMMLALSAFLFVVSLGIAKVIQKKK